MKKVEILRKKYPRFVYDGYSWRILNRNLNISFNFKIESPEECPPYIGFKPKLIVKNVDKKRVKRIGESRLNNLIFNLGLIEMLSYWKATCSPEILIKAGSLNQEQIKWWKDLINRGMGQFFFENKINFTKNSPRINFTRLNLVKLKRCEKDFKKRVLVPVGGGKDSVVTLETLRKAKKDVVCFALNLNSAAQKIMKMASMSSPQVAGCRKPVIVERKIDKKLLELNRKGFLNGHTPFSAYLAFLSILVAVIFDYKGIAFSNERSSNEGNVKYLGKIVNHQYSKSFDFEEKFRDYSKKYLAKNVEYFSFLRPLYEIQISKLFSKHSKYFNAFLSCNRAFKTYSGREKPTGKWCGNCPKCLFIFAILYPFVDEKKLIEIFGQNLFENRKLLPLMQELIGEKGFKPFECVGTKKESQVALLLSLKIVRGRASYKSYKLPYILRYFEKKILPKYPNLEREAKKIMNSWSNQHNLPKEFEKILKRTQLLTNFVEVL